jgi:HK97 family phage major capsid protein
MPNPTPVITGFRSFGEQLLAVRAAELQPYKADPRLLHHRAASGASEKVPADGGFLVDAQFVPQIVERMYQTGEILSRCSEMPISAPNANGLKFPKFKESSRANGSRLGGVSAAWADEATAATASRPKFELAELLPKKLIALIYSTEELVRDAAALDTFTRAAFAQEMAFVLENSVVGGSGAGRPQGVLNSPALITVAAEGGQTPGTVNSTNITKMLARLWAPSKKNAVWIVNAELLPMLYTLALVTGSAAVRLFEFADGSDAYDRIAGIPVIAVEYCSAVGSVGDIILGDFSRYVIAKREDRADVSIHVNFLSDEDAFRFVMRVDGQPIDSTPVTPLNGSATTSPFVTLAAR